MFNLINEDGNARTGVLEREGRKVETPFFMPVATRAVGRFVASDDYNLSKTDAIICNAFLLSLNPGLETFEKFGGVHNFMNYNKFIFTDCGGFQMLRDNLLEETTNNGILFKNPHGKDVFMRASKTMEIGEKIDADVIMALDCVLPYGKEKKDYEEALVKSHKWSKQCKDLHKTSHLLFGITQGGTFEDLRVDSAKAINEIDFDGNAIGGLGIGETNEEMYNMIKISVPHLNKNKPRYLMGIGKPEQILECVERGVDVFDSIYPQKNGRHGMMFTFKGRLDLGQVKHKFDKTPIDVDCGCFVCKNYSRGYLRYLLKKDDAVGKRYLTIHNIYFMQEFMRKIRESIKENKFQKFKEEFLKNWKKI
ncbi:MAG: tRNA guanosine(34) transglycosylase Tgt [Nanoarchaeota archaeon]|nr:tRNA guanosine(34) transglycosylase Tgt [Nanoarchaeota archaeon]